MESSHDQIRTEWYQSLDAITFTYFVKNRKESDITVTLEERSYEVVIKLDGTDREFHHNIDPLYAAIQTTSSTAAHVNTNNNGTTNCDVTSNKNESKAFVINIRPIKVEVKVWKVVPAQWPVLEGTEEVIHSVLPSSASELPVPSNRKKNWDKVNVDDDEADEKPQGEDALNKLFQQIYGNGSDEQRRAMIKSFTESGGTVLSTNWEDVGRRNVTAEPPTGMEAKKVNEETSLQYLKSKINNLLITSLNIWKKKNKV